MTGDMDQMIDNLLKKHEALSSILSILSKKEKEKGIGFFKNICLFGFELEGSSEFRAQIRAQVDTYSDPVWAL